MSVAAIIPAYNEEHTIGAVIQAIRNAKTVDEIIVVSDGSTDRTASVAAREGARVIVSSSNFGKGDAMQRGVSQTNADIFFFCDADLVGLRPDHVQTIIEPVRKKDVVMCVGLRDRLGIPEMIAHLDPLLAIGGERAVRRDLWEMLSPAERHGFEVEVALNGHCKRQHLPVFFYPMTGVTHRLKEEKWGVIQGVARRYHLFMDIVTRRLKYLFLRKQ